MYSLDVHKISMNTPTYLRQFITANLWQRERTPPKVCLLINSSKGLE